MYVPTIFFRDESQRLPKQRKHLIVNLVIMASATLRALSRDLFFLKDALLVQKKHALRSRKAGLLLRYLEQFERYWRRNIRIVKSFVR